MKKSELIELLSSSDEEEVFIDVDDTLYEIEPDHVDEVFDGFDTVYPACIALKPGKPSDNYGI